MSSVPLPPVTTEPNPAVDEPVTVPERNIIPAVRTLNSKLTGRRSVRPEAPPPDEEEDEDDESSYTTYPTDSEYG